MATVEARDLPPGTGAPVPPPRRRRSGPAAAVRGMVRAFSTVLILSGSLLILDAALTLVWQEPVSALYARATQEALAGDLDRLNDLSGLQLRALESLRDQERRTAFLARAVRRRAKPGDAIGRVRSARMKANFVVVEGTDARSLRKGPGHYPDTPLPGLPGTTAIAGHRTTYGAPFRQLNLMRRGDPIVLDMPYGRFTYRTELRRIVSPSAYRYVTRRVGHDRLALTACHPMYSAAQRIVVFARLVSFQPQGRASRSGSVSATPLEPPGSRVPAAVAVVAVAALVAAATLFLRRRRRGARSPD